MREPRTDPRAAPAVRPALSLVIPALNEAAVLPRMWARLAPILAGLEEQGLSLEVVFVDDGSTDDTLRLTRALPSPHAALRVVELSRRYGHQAAIAAGLAHARGEAAVVLDADLQDPPELIPELVARWREGHDVVYGQRRSRAGETPFKRASAHLFYRGLALMMGELARPDVGEFALIDRRVIDALSAAPGPRPFLRGALAAAGFRHTGVSYDRAPREAGDTKFNLRRMLSLATDAITALTWAPLRLASLAGALALCAGGGGLFLGATPTAWAIVLMGGVQLLAIGLLGEYLGRVHEAVSGRPLYLVREVYEGKERGR